VSFRGRLVLAYLALLALTLAAFGVGVYAYVDTRLHRDLVSGFEAQAKQYAQLVSGSGGYAYVWGIKQKLEVEPQRLPNLYYAVDARHLPQETKDFKDVSVTSPGLTDGALPAVPADGKAHLVPAERNGLGRPLAVYRLSIKAVAGNSVILVPQQTRPPRTSTGTGQRPLSTDAPTLAVNPTDQYQGSLTLARDLRDLEASTCCARSWSPAASPCW
jgi:hypothetical protein